MIFIIKNTFFIKKTNCCYYIISSFSPSWFPVTRTSHDKQSKAQARWEEISSLKKRLSDCQDGLSAGCTPRLLSAPGTPVLSCSGLTLFPAVVCPSFGNLVSQTFSPSHKRFLLHTVIFFVCFVLFCGIRNCFLSNFSEIGCPFSPFVLLYQFSSCFNNSKSYIACWILSHSFFFTQLSEKVLLILITTFLYFCLFSYFLSDTSSTQQRKEKICIELFSCLNASYKIKYSEHSPPPSF